LIELTIAVKIRLNYKEKISIMKKVMFLMLAGSLVLGSCKKEGCTDATATNYDDKAKDDDGSCKFAAIVVTPVADTEVPVVTISSPAASAAFAPGEKVQITATITDNVGATTWSYSILDAENAVKGTENLNLLGTTSEAGSAEYTVPANAEGGNYTVSITASDAAGNTSIAATVLIVVETPVSTDSEKPVVLQPVKTFPLSGTNISQGTGGTKGAKFDIEVSDNVEIDKITVILWNTTKSTEKFKAEFTDVNAKTFKQNVVIQYTGDVNDKAKVKVIATDKAGNETELLSTVEYDLTLS
jgi:hypothetical protein